MHVYTWGIRESDVRRRGRCSGMLNGVGRELERKWSVGEGCRGVDVSVELGELMRMYEDTERGLKVRVWRELEEMVGCMRSFVEVYDRYGEVKRKMGGLREKMKRMGGGV